MTLRFADDSRAGRFLRSPSARALAALALVVLIGAIFNADGAFFRWHTHRDMLRHISVFGILACGMTLVIITSGIDLAVGSVLGLSAVLFSLFSLQLGWPAWLAILACLLAGAACGLTSGGLVAKFRLQPFIATLAMMVFARGLAKWISGGRKISTAVQLADGRFEYREVPPVFKVIGSKLFAENIAVVTIIFLACVLVCYVLLAKLRWGRHLYAIGGNEEAARLSGVPVARTKLLAYGLGGLLSAVAGICHAVQEQQGDPEAGSSYELTAIAIVVIGGTNMNGGKGGMGLTLIGAMTIGYLEKILSINAVGEATRLMLTGLIIVGAVLFQRHRK
ncbi:MAG TPA: ABC transporter permease [Candidatus Aminicenantes bacterium]|nr:ABC transporter permease [Candidatus Aminicenantes bacterium]HRY65692.1 ABC transporter permease [Candidatus Aminicenantes bacterium]HRZ72606.1 ABC transporter permease [Candidatus Aminicenantes bacterium]